MSKIIFGKLVRGKKFLVTGGAGFVGSHMIDLIIKKGGTVICLDNLSTGKMDNIKHLVGSSNFSFFNVDVNNLSKIEKIFKDAMPDYVMHYAAMVGVERTSLDPLGVFDDIDGIKNIAKLSQKYGAKKILFASSSEVYGEPIKMPMSEYDRYQSQWPYGLVKIFAEVYLIAFSKKFNIPVVIPRFFNVYGPRQDDSQFGFVVPIFLNNALGGGEMGVFGDGSQTRNFVYVDDNVRLCLEAFFTEEANGRPMNIGSGKSVKIIDLAKTIKKIIKEAKIAHKPLRIDGEIIYRVPDVTFMKKALNDWPKIELEEGLKKTIIYLKKKNK